MDTHIDQRSSPGLKDVKQILAIGSGKGGVGKSAVSVQLAHCLVEKGYKVGLLDADIYGPSCPKMLGVEEGIHPSLQKKLTPVDSYGIKFVSMSLLTATNDPIVWRAPMALKMIQQFLLNVYWGNLDFLLIDLPPGTGDIQLTLAQQASLTGAIIVTTPQQVAVGIAQKGLKMFQQVNVPIVGIVENMSGLQCPHCQEVSSVFGEGGGEELAQTHQVDFLGKIPLDPALKIAGDKGLPAAQSSVSKNSYNALTRITDSLLASLTNIQRSSQWSIPQKMLINQQGQLEITWPDHHQGLHSAQVLRGNCPCASCVEETTGKRKLTLKDVPLNIAFQSIQPVGRYAIAPTFSDQHRTGIFQYSLLKKLCECPVCANANQPKDLQESFEV